MISNPNVKSARWLTNVQALMVPMDNPTLIAQISADWAQQTFGNGPIKRNSLKAVLLALKKRHALPMFERVYAAGAGQLFERNAAADWWEGMDASSNLAAEDEANFIAKHLSRGQDTIDFEEWNRLSLAHTRAVAPSFEIQFLQEHAEDIQYVTAWLAALKYPKERTDKVSAALSLSVLWDCWTIPLRYFTDDAAMELINAVARRRHLPGEIIDLDSYRKSVRSGQRSPGLGLRGDYPKVVSLQKDEINVFRVSRSVAKSVGLNVDLLPSISQLATLPISFVLAD
jgi:hypothetical protein